MNRGCRAMLASLVAVFGVATTSLAGAMYQNTSGAVARAIQIEFSEPAEITSMWPSFPQRDPQGLATVIVLSGGEIAAGGWFSFTWRPDSARVVRVEWMPLRVDDAGGHLPWVGELICGAHIGGAWGLNGMVDDFASVGLEYYEHYLRINANWVGISISLTISDSMDPTVSTCGPDDEFPTFSDQQLRDLTMRLRELGFRVYWTLAFESMGDGPAGMQAERFHLGDPFAYRNSPMIRREYWPWDPAHPEHANYTAEFWRTYTAQAVHYARIAAETGVEMFSLGTETECLFRTRVAPPYWVTEFREELSSMVEEVRSVFPGAVTYDMLYSGLEPYTVYPYADALWGDLDLDVIGVSAWFPLLQHGFPGVPPVGVLQEAWRRVFRESLQPLRYKYPDKPIVFLEFGCNNVIGASVDPNRDAYVPFQYRDGNNSGLDDGDEEQRTIIEALFLTMQEQPGVLSGLFLWGMQLGTDEQWRTHFLWLRDPAVRARPAEDLVARWFAGWVGERVLTESALEAESTRQEAVRAVMDAIAWHALPVVLNWDNLSSCGYGSVDLRTGVYTREAERSPVFGDAGWRVRQVGAGITPEGLAIEIRFFPGDTPSPDGLVEYVINLGDSRSVGVLAAQRMVSINGVSSRLWWNPGPRNIQVSSAGLRLIVPHATVIDVLGPYQSFTPCEIRLSIAHRGREVHSFVFFSGTGRLAGMYP